MRKRIHKLFWAWDFEKEEKWLNEMSAIGLQLISVSGIKYEFDEGLQGEYTYRLELLNTFAYSPESAAYIHFIEDTGAEHVGTFKNWVYFRKKTELGNFEIYSNIDSKIKHLNRIIKMLIFPLLFLAYFIFTWITSYINGHIDKSMFWTFIILYPLLAIWITYGIIRLCNKKKNLQKERSLRE